MSAVDAAFSASYREARSKFCAAAAAAGLQVHSRVEPRPGIDGEELALDVVRDGAASADRVLLVSSACHGIEGYCGSGVQVLMLGDQAFRAEAARRGVAVVYLHALNPHGFSHGRRVTAEGVDLNRNFQDFAKPLPENPGYDELAWAVLPATWPPPAEAEAALQDYAARHGPFGLQEAISSGQYRHPAGLFFGGREPTWSHRQVRQALREQASGARRIGWIDIHTGLGPSGVGERIFAGLGDPVGHARAKAWWGDGVTSMDDGRSTSTRLSGVMASAVAQECPGSEITAMALEYGTVPVMTVMHALRADHWLAEHPQAGHEQRQAIRQQIRDAFYVDTPEWRQAVVEQAFTAARQALAGLSG